MNFDKKVVVIYGGVSSEREVSIKSGVAVYSALKRFGYKNVELFDLNSENVFKLNELDADIAFLALHGRGGEDGCIQGVLELAHIPYTGPGVATSALCMNKVFTKQVLSAAGLPTAKYIEVRKCDYCNKDKLVNVLESSIGFPMVVKSPCQGSSIGVFVVHDKEELAVAITQVYKYGNQLLAEEYLSGIEITLPIIGNTEIIVLPDIEVTSENEFFDYEAKYTEGLCHHIIPARINQETRDMVIELGKRAYYELNCCGISRIDFIVDKAKGPMIIEVNTLPGMTEMSLVPDAAKAIGISFEQLCSMILEYGIEASRDLF